MPPETPDSLAKDALQAQVARLLARLDEVVGQNGQLLARNEALLARIAELERRLDLPPKTPTNSSLPPSTGQKANSSSDSSGTPPKKKGRKGRKGVARSLCSDPDKTRDIYAEACVCGAVLSEADQPDVFAYDHIELPVIKPITTRINLHKGQCPCCKRRVAAKPPADMPPGSPFGPKIVETVTYFHACQMVSYNRLTEVMAGLFGLKISEGAFRQHARPRGQAPRRQRRGDRRDRAGEPRHRQRRNLGPRLRQDPLAVDVPRRDGRLPHHRADAGQGGADRVPGRRQTASVDLRPPRGAVPSRRHAGGVLRTTPSSSASRT